MNRALAPRRDAAISTRPASSRRERGPHFQGNCRMLRAERSSLRRSQSVL